ncbi:MAG: serine hydrolase, partial [bacterium]
MDAIAQSKHEFHSLMVVRHGQVVVEGWWAPYRADLKHTLYSMSKSFTSTAVGFAVAEGKLKTTDTVISFFPEDLPSTVSDNLAKLTIKDLLSMSVGQEAEPLIRDENNWVK